MGRQNMAQGMTSLEASQLQPAVAVSPLDFQVDQYITIGSPNGLFLALRKVSQCVYIIYAVVLPVMYMQCVPQGVPHGTLHISVQFC